MVKKKSGRSGKNLGNVLRVKKVLDTGFLFSVGIASIAKENAEKIVKDLVMKGRLNEKQGRKVVNDLIKRSRKERERVKRLLMR